MLEPMGPAYRQPLPGGLVLRTCASERDLERLADFNAAVHDDPGVAGMTRNLLRHHPATRNGDFVFVEDESGQVISSLCLIPWTLCLENASLPAGEMGIVGTLEPYRNRGLIRAQVAYFKRRLRERGCLLSHIQGIPFFYRQFGYEYALPLDAGLRLELRDIPAAPEAGTWRLAAAADIPALARLYDAAAQDLGLHAVRDAAIWHYLLEHTAGTAMAYATWVLEGRDGTPSGYVRVPAAPPRRELQVNETSRLSGDEALAALAHLGELAAAREAPFINFNLPTRSVLARQARALGAQERPPYAWQIQVPDPAALLRALGPAFSRRLAGSPYAGLTRDVPLGCYRERFTLHFVDGRLEQVTRASARGRAEVNFPPRLLVQLMLGHRGWEDLRAISPDVSVAPLWRLPIDTLFPRVPAFLYTEY